MQELLSIKDQIIEALKNKPDQVIYYPQYIHQYIPYYQQPYQQPGYGYQVYCGGAGAQQGSAQINLQSSSGAILSNQNTGNMAYINDELFHTTQLTKAGNK